MNRILRILLFFIALTCLSVNADSWDDFSNVDRMWDGQKSITNQEFEQVMDKLEENTKKKEAKKEKKKRKKLFGSGSTLHAELNPDGEVKELDILNPEKDGILINLPVNIVLEDKIVEKGYYKVFAESDKDSGKKYISFYQSQFYKGKIEVTTTEDDYGEEELNFARIIPHNNSFVKIIFGSIDFNAYAFIPFVD